MMNKANPAAQLNNDCCLGKRSSKEINVQCNIDVHTCSRTQIEIQITGYLPEGTSNAPSGGWGAFQKTPVSLLLSSQYLTQINRRCPYPFGHPRGYNKND